MKYLLKFELKKIFKTKTFYIFLILNAVALLMSLHLSPLKHVGMYIYDNIGPMQYSTYLAGLFMAVYICSEYMNHTVSNIYSKGYTKIQVLLSKLITCMIVLTIYLCFNIFFRLILGLIFVKPEKVKLINFPLHFAIKILWYYVYNIVVFSILYSIKNVFICLPISVLGIHLLDFILEPIFKNLQKQNILFYITSLDTEGRYYVDFMPTDLLLNNMITQRFSPTFHTYANWQYPLVISLLILYSVVALAICVFADSQSEKI